MSLRSAFVIALIALSPAAALAQTMVRFDTNVGNIDMVLNPLGIAELRGHEENMLAYIESGRYEKVVVNRADNGGDAANPANDFVLQFGGFTTQSQTLPPTFNAFDPVESFGPVIVDFNGDNTPDFDTTDLTNSRGTVSLALGGNPTDVNSGSTSFFVNVNDNPGLDASGFVPFATVKDMSTVDLIMRLAQANLGDAGLASSNIPLIDGSNNLLVFVERSYVLSTVAPAAAAVLASPAAASGGSGEETLAEGVIGVPEPTGAVLALLGAAALCRRGSRR